MSHSWMCNLSGAEVRRDAVAAGERSAKEGPRYRISSPPSGFCRSRMMRDRCSPGLTRRILGSPGRDVNDFPILMLAQRRRVAGAGRNQHFGRKRELIIAAPLRVSGRSSPMYWSMVAFAAAV